MDPARVGADVELAVYFACLEAMQNAANRPAGSRAADRA
jgi:hypothetical protein